MRARRIFRRIIFGIIVAAVGGFLLMGLIAKVSKPETPPSLVDAPFAIQTSSRYYYAHELRLVRQTPEIRGYWTFDGKHYTYHAGTKDFPRDLYPRISIIRRVKA